MPRIVSTAERGVSEGTPPWSRALCLLSSDAPRIVRARPIHIVRDTDAVLGLIGLLFRPADLFAPANDAPPVPAVGPIARGAPLTTKAIGLDGFISAMVELLHRDLFGGAQ